MYLGSGRGEDGEGGDDAEGSLSSNEQLFQVIPCRRQHSVQKNETASLPASQPKCITKVCVCSKTASEV